MFGPNVLGLDIVLIKGDIDVLDVVEQHLEIKAEKCQSVLFQVTTTRDDRKKKVERKNVDQIETQNI